MSLRNKTLLTAALTLALLVLVAGLGSRAILTRDFAQLERRDVLHSLMQGDAAVRSLLGSVSAANRDWANWDDVYAFARNRDPAFIRLNLYPKALTNVNLDLVVVVDRAGRVVHAATSADPQERPSTGFVPPDDTLRAAGFLQPRSVGVVSGLLCLPHGVLLVSSHPILTSEGRGPPRGTLVCGRYLGAEEQALLSRSLALRARIDPYSPRLAAAAGLGSDAGSSAALGAGMAARPVSGDDVQGCQALSDLTGRPAAILTVTMPRDIFRQGQTTISYVVGVVAAAGLCLGLTLLVLLERLVLNRLKRLGARLREMAAAGDATARLPVEGRDELGEVVQALNTALDSRERSQDDLREREKSLSAAESLYRGTIDALPDWVFVVDADLRIEISNNGFRQFCQNSLAADRLPGHALLAAFPCLDPAAGEQYQEVFCTGRPRQSEEQLASCRQQVHAEMRRVPIVEDGRVTRVLTIVRDITGRRWDELALRLAEEKFRRLFAEAPVGIFQATLDGKLLAANDALARLVGHQSAGELLVAAGSDDRILGSGPQEAAALVAEALASPEALRVLREYRGGQGQVVTAWLNLRPVRDSHGNPQLLEGFVDDVTAQKRVEQEAENLRKFLDAVVANMPLAVYVKEVPSYRLVTWNRAAEDLFETPASQALGHPDHELFAPGEAALTRTLDEEAVAGQALLDIPERALVTARHGPRVLHTRRVPIPDDLGRPRHLLCISEDITARKQAELTLSRTLADVARSNTELEQFAYVASHDLQEPLRMVASYLQLLQRRYQGQLDEDADTFIGFAVEGATRMQHLISDLLAYSRVGTRGVEFQDTDLEAVWREALANLELKITETGAVITQDPLPVVWGDSVQLGQLLQNLVSNALKFRRPDEPPRVHLQAATTDQGWQLAVRDHGIGLDLGHAERIFVIFQRLHSRDEYPGTGIGLAICKRIAERHGGRIWVESRPDEGATFSFTLLRRTETEVTDSWAA
jgi:PAS domain S-box-containing protein